MSGIQHFSFGEGDSGIGGKMKPWKAEANRTYRLSFLWWKGLEDGKPDLDAKAPLFAGGQANFIPNVGYIVNKGPEYTKLAGGEAPRMRIATIVAIWPTDKLGQVDKSALARGDVEVLPWVISGDKFNALKAINNEFPFGHHDLTANCTDAQFQKMTFSPCRDSLLKTLLANPKAGAITESVISKAQSLAGNINDHIGRDMTVQQIRDKLAGGTSGGGSSSPVESMAVGDIDSMVDNMLDS